MHNFKLETTSAKSLHFVHKISHFPQNCKTYFSIIKEKEEKNPSGGEGPLFAILAIGTIPLLSISREIFFLKEEKKCRFPLDFCGRIRYNEENVTIG